MATHNPRPEDLETPVILDSPINAWRTFRLAGRRLRGGAPQDKLYLGSIGLEAIWPAREVRAWEMPTVQNKVGLHAYLIPDYEQIASKSSERTTSLCGVKSVVPRFKALQGNIAAKVKASGVILVHADGVIRASKMSIEKLILMVGCWSCCGAEMASGFCAGYPVIEGELPLYRKIPNVELERSGYPIRAWEEGFETFWYWPMCQKCRNETMGYEESMWKSLDEVWKGLSHYGVPLEAVFDERSWYNAIYAQS